MESGRGTIPKFLDDLTSLLQFGDLTLPVGSTIPTRVVAHLGQSTDRTTGGVSFR